MMRFFSLLARVIVTTLLLVLLTRFADGAGYASVSRIAGMPLVDVRDDGARGVIALGQTASGVVVFAQGGTGLITFAQAGVGLLFGVGQLMIGLLAICQVGFGLFFFLGQGGGGLFCLGQVVFGYAGAGQAAGTFRGMDRLKELEAEVADALLPRHWFPLRRL